MSALHLLFGLSSVLGTLPLAAGTAEACSCGGTQSITEASRMDAVFVATVARIDVEVPSSTAGVDGTVRVFGGGRGTAVLTVERVFRGSVGGRVSIPPGLCDVRFAAGERWLVYASVDDAGLHVGGCGRSRLLDVAAQDLAYLEGREQGRPLGVFHGRVLHRQRGADGGIEFVSRDVPLTVVALAAGVRMETPVQKWGSFDLVLRPGRYDVWVEDHDGRRVSAASAAEVAADAAVELRMVVD
jgi:hypothetical protein